MNVPPVISEIPKKPSLFPLWWALAVNVLAFLLTVQFYWVPSGARIRPMGWAMFVFILAFAGLAAIPMLTPALKIRPRLTWPWVVFILAITPFPLSQLMFHHAERVCHFIVEP